MSVSVGRKRSDRVLQRQVSLPLHHDGLRIDGRLAAGMTGRHGGLSAMRSHVMAALALRGSWGETRQQTRHGRCHCPQQDSAQHNGGSYAVHFHESIPLLDKETGYRFVERCAVTAITGRYLPGHVKKLGCRRPVGYCLHAKRHVDVQSDM